MTSDKVDGVFLRAADMVRMTRTASLGSVTPSEVVRAVAEIFRLRAKCRGQRVMIEALRLKVEALAVERDALADLVVAYAPAKSGSGKAL